MKKTIKEVRLQKSYEHLLFSLVNDFGIKSISIENSIIKVHGNTGLFDYDQYAFFNKKISQMEISKYIKKFNNEFYAEWHDYNSMIICY